MSANLAKHCVDFGVGTSKLVGEESALGVTYKLNKRHENPPWMRAMTENSLEEYFGDYFFKCLVFDLQEQIKKQGTEPKGVMARES